MLRTDLFKTVEREETRFIAIRDALTLPSEPADDIKFIDAKHCRQGRLGCGYHFYLLTTGVIQLGRDINTVGAHSRYLDDVSVGIGVVGGKNERRENTYTRTEEQEEALDDLIDHLLGLWPAAEIHDQPSLRL